MPLRPIWTITTVSISIIDLAKTRAWKLRWSQPLKLFQAKALLANGTWGCPHCASIHHWDFPLESFSGALYGSKRVDPSFSCIVAHIKDLGFVGLVDQKSYTLHIKWCEGWIASGVKNSKVLARFGEKLFWNPIIQVLDCHLDEGLPTQPGDAIIQTMSTTIRDPEKIWKDIKFHFFPDLPCRK